jgi:hypothetical protein
MVFRTGMGLSAGALVIFFLLGIIAGQEEKEFDLGSDTNLEWAKDYDSAVNTAKTKYMPVLIYFYGREGIDLCKQAETEVFKKPTVKSQAKKFACVKIDGASKEGEELCKKYSITAGSFAIVLLNYELTESARVGEEKELKKLAEAMRKVAADNKKISEMFKNIEKAFEQAMECKRKSDMRTCVTLMEEIVACKGKVESKFIAEAEKVLQELEKQGARLLSEAEQDISEAERSLSWLGTGTGTQGFRLDLVNNAQQKLMRVARDFPVQSLKERLTSAQTRLATLTAEYQRRTQQQQGQQGQQGQGQPGGR